VPYPYTGVSMEAVDYRQYQTGTTPLLLPIRFPGQYYDGETDLNENWNRFYDPGTGRYLEVEPMLARPFEDKALPKHGPTSQMLPIYAYAKNNPVHYTDRDGRGPEDILESPAGPEFLVLYLIWLALQEAVSSCGHSFSMPSNPPPPPDKCPPCPPPPPGRIDYSPVSQHGCPPGYHQHTIVSNQVPWPDCTCFENKGPVVCL
jgi:RHS repeat-associated protein